MSAQNLFDWMDSQIPRYTNSLNKPATMKEISSLEALLGVEFPDSLRKMYLLHDGQSDSCTTGPFYGLSFLPLNKVQARWELGMERVSEMTESELLDVSSFCESRHRGVVKSLRYNPKWIPFADDAGGNYLGLDFDPGQNGIVGQVINFGRDEDTKYALAKSFDAFLVWLLNELGGGNFKIAKHGAANFSLNTKYPPTKHFLDSLKGMF